MEKPMNYRILEAGIYRYIKQMGLEDIDGKFNFLFIIFIIFNVCLFEYILLLNIKAKLNYKHLK